MSQVTLLTGVLIVLGLYVVKFSANDGSAFNSALSVASTSQAEQLAKSGSAIALARFADRLTIYYLDKTVVSTMGGTITYSAITSPSNPSQRLVTSIGTYNGIEVKSTAVLYYYGGRWKVLRQHII